MRPFYDDPDEFDFSDSMAVNRIRREQRREERRSLSRRFHGRASGSRYADFEDFYDYDGYEGGHEEYYDHRPRPGRNH